MLDAKEIQKIIPHRYPMLLVDKIVEIEPEKKAVGIKNVTINEPFFQGHFPGNPIMPGVLIVEAMAQVCAITVLADKKESGKLGVFTGIDACKFKRQVVPGDRLRMEVEIIKLRSSIGKAECRAFVGEELAARATLTFGIIDTEI